MKDMPWEPNKAIKMQQDEIDRLLTRISELEQEIGRLEGNVEGLQAEAAAITDLAQRMADFLWGISRGMPFGRDVAQQLNQEYCSRKTTAGQSIIDRQQKAEAIVKALQRLKAAEMRIGAASLSGLQEIKAASQERYDAEKALDAALAEYEGAK